MDKLKVWFILGLFVFYLGFGMSFIFFYKKKKELKV